LVATQIASNQYAQARRADQRQRPGLLDEGRVQVAQHHLPLQLRPEAEVKLLNRGRKRETGRL